MALKNRHESIEDYLETILELSKIKQVVRSIDIAQAMNYSKPSISIAMKKLKEKHDTAFVFAAEYHCDSAQNLYGE